MLLALSDELTVDVSRWEVLRIVITAGVVLLILALARFLIARGQGAASEGRLRGQITMLLLGHAGAVAIILALPVGLELRIQLLKLVGLLLSAAVALASTSMLANILAGVMLRTLRNFKVGDFLSVEDHFGRVTERGLFHTEIQTEDRDLTTFPNVYLSSHPVKVIRSSGTIVSAAVSLGYDVPRARVKELLLAAAQEVGLEDPFVRIVALGDFTVEYRVGGLLESVKELLSTRTALRGAMLDELHQGGVEIASPAVLAVRSLEGESRLVPKRVATREPEAAAIESVAFDKADQAESIEELRRELDEVVDERKGLDKKRKETNDALVRDALADEVERLKVREGQLAALIESRQETLDS